MHWFFITSSIINLKHIFYKKEYAEIILNSLNYFIQKNKLYIGAFVIMPNHIHIIAKTRNNHSLANINRDFKKFTAQKIIFVMKDRNDKLIKNFIVNKSDRKIQIWKRSPYIKNIHSTDFMVQKMEYIHNNPCQKHWNLINLPEDYEYSSASFYIKDKPNKYLDIFDLRTIL
ncbi:transposase [candidate division KSB1 bacterium]